MVWGVQRVAARRVERLLNQPLVEEHRQALAKVFRHHPEKADKTNLSWL